MQEKELIKKGTRNIIIIGLISCFADISSEMVYPIIPLYLTAVFGATPVLVGLIEGIAESLASLLKVFSGYISDKYRCRKSIAFSGYATGLIYKLALIFANSWFGILIARIIDRFGKGIRTAPRDAMIADSASDKHIGKSFGIHKMLDMLGSAIGILLAYFIVKNTNESGYKLVFGLSIIPIVIALILFVFIKDKRGIDKKERVQFWHNLGNLDNNLKVYLVITFLFTLGNSSNSFLLLKASDIGFSSSDTILLYFVYNLCASLFAIPFGKLSDKIGRKKLLVMGFLTFSLVYFGFAFCKSKTLMIIIFIIYGLYTALTTGAERAYISEIAPNNLKGTMLGLHSTIVGIALLPASLIAGLLWDNIGSYAPFIFGASLALISAFLLIIKINTNIQEV